MKNKYRLFILQILLIAGIVVLASLQRDGWGWLVFALLLTLG